MSDVRLHRCGGPHADATRRGLTAAGSTDVEVYDAILRAKRYSVIVSRDPFRTAEGLPDYRWHVSVAGQEKVPEWRAFVAIVQAVRPGVMFCVPMPPRTFWMNCDPRVLHVHETRDQTLIAQWRFEGRGDTPT
jgi:hypothetical protein